MHHNKLYNKEIIALSPDKVAILKEKMLQWAQPFSIFSFLDNRSYASSFGQYECLLAVGKDLAHQEATKESLQQAILDAFKRRHWLFGHIGYDFKNELENKLKTPITEKDSFGTFGLFIPETLILISKDLSICTIHTYYDPTAIWEEICTIELPSYVALPTVSFTPLYDKSCYLDKISAIKQHIAQGDCYELNFCVKAQAKAPNLPTKAVYERLASISPAPFSAMYKLHQSYMMCASPERYFQKQGQILTAQPIKGTSSRGGTEEQDEAQKVALRQSIKEQAENVMIVDLMRNDMSKVCQVGSIEVTELFGIYTFPQVHQMISTIQGTLKEEASCYDVIQHTFPMGSMTGAPKFKVMELIKQYEVADRGLYSGTIGYIDPEGNADFNVIIRSLFYDAQKEDLYYYTGGAITTDSDPEMEYEEVRLKAWALERIFDTNA